LDKELVCLLVCLEKDFYFTILAIMMNDHGVGRFGLHQGLVVYQQQSCSSGSVICVGMFESSEFFGMMFYGIISLLLL